MSHRVCPWWLGYLLLFPLRRIRQSPRRLLGAYVREGMTVLETGPGMGYFTLDVARMVGPAGRVVAVDVQERMLKTLRKRAVRAGLRERIDIRRSEADRLGIDDLAGRVDLILAIFVVHEMPDAGKAFAEAYRALIPGGRLLFAEPRRHVSAQEFEALLAEALGAGFKSEGPIPFPGGRAVMLARKQP